MTTQMDSRSILIGLHEIEGVGLKSIQTIMNAEMDMTDLIQYSSEGYEKLGLQRIKAQLIAASLNESFIRRKLAQYEIKGISIITIYDEDYPHYLKQIAVPPWVLYYEGDPLLLKKPMIAVVGTRTPTSYGKKVAGMLAKDLSELGICVVSGMARGIDSEAHRGALPHQGGTIAVLGTPIDTIYPPENASLYREIAAKGLILSEYPLGTKLHPGLFPQRNRIIAGLSMGTVVVEAAQDSGSLITAKQAQDESRDLFAVPGPITSPKSFGALELLKNHAYVVTTVKDITDQYKHLTEVPQPLVEQKVKPVVQLTADEQLVADLITSEPITFNRLLEQSGYDFGHLHSLLLSLLINQQIEQLPGSSFITIL